ncbi:MAG TPA: hypothetical protein VGH34_23300 [Vicinamibacterales bacterium]
MTTRTSLATAFALALGLAISGASAHAWTDANRTTLLTFSGPVGLPGMTLGTGTYVFDVLNPQSGADVVRVRSKDQKHTYFLGMTNHVDRPAGMKTDSFITLGEVSRGSVPPIVAWYPGGADGRQFLYPRTR